MTHKILIPTTLVLLVAALASPAVALKQIEVPSGDELCSDLRDAVSSGKASPALSAQLPLSFDAWAACGIVLQVVTTILSTSPGSSVETCVYAPDPYSAVVTELQCADASVSAWSKAWCTGDAGAGYSCAIFDLSAGGSAWTLGGSASGSLDDLSCDWMPGVGNVGCSDDGREVDYGTTAGCRTMTATSSAWVVITTPPVTGCTA